MYCRAIPYEGDEPYIFVSYCRKDAQYVYPLLEQMGHDGYRVWYDNGIHPGDDWLENIALHLKNSAFCVAMLSGQSVASHNCKSEMNFAIECRKRLIAVLLEEFQMPLGMRLQLGTIQHIKKQDATSSQMLLAQIYSVEGIHACKEIAAKETSDARKAKPQIEICSEPILKKHTVTWMVDGVATTESYEYGAVLNVPAKPQKEHYTFAGWDPKIPAAMGAEDITFTALWIADEYTILFRGNGGEEIEALCGRYGTAVTLPGVVREGYVFSGWDSNGDGMADYQANERVILASNMELNALWHMGASKKNISKTRIASEQDTMILVQLSTKKCFVLHSAFVRLGRAVEQCDVAFPNISTISSCHADILQSHHKCYIRDAGSLNGTFLNGTRVSEEKGVELENTAIFRLHTEEFMLLFGESAKQAIERGKIALLQNVETKETKLVDQMLYLGRNYPWSGGTWEDPKVSRNHAEVFWYGAQLYICDKASMNGTYLRKYEQVDSDLGERIGVHKKEIRLDADKPYVLNENDILRMGDTVISMVIATVK